MKEHVSAVRFRVSGKKLGVGARVSGFVKEYMLLTPDTCNLEPVF
jgi:hypothetical protein